MGAKTPSLGSTCAYILILPTQNPCFCKEVPVQSLIYLEKCTFAAISEKGKSVFFYMRVIKIIKPRL